MSHLKHSGSVNPELMWPELSYLRPYCNMPSSNIIYKKEFLIMKTNINKFIAPIAICAIGFISTSAFAVKDDALYHPTLHFQQAQQKLEQAKAATGTGHHLYRNRGRLVLSSCGTRFTQPPSGRL